MSKFGNYFCSTIGRKQSMAIAGLALCGFILMHAAGNMLLFKSAEAYNRYSHALITNPLILVAEAGLVVFFLVHIVFGILMTKRNMGARPVGYEVSASGPKGTSLLKKTMAIQGLVVLVFVVWHLITFKYGVEYEIQYGDTKMRDLFRLVHETFQNQFYAIWYVVAVSILCAHVAHGFHSGLQTLGLNHPKYESLIHKTSVAFGLLVTAMFISQPIYMGFFFKG